MDIKRKLYSAKKLIIKESPSILTALGVGGVFSTMILTAKSTIEAMNLIMKYDDSRWDDGRKPPPLEPKEIVKLVWKKYIPPVSSGFITIVCIVGANTVSSRRHAAIAGLYKITETAFNEYVDSVQDIVGQNKSEKIREQAAQNALDKNPVENVIITGNGEVLFYDSLSGRYFKSNMEIVKKAVNEFNYLLNQQMYIPLNEFYDILGLEFTEMGRASGWDSDRGLMDIVFTAKIATNNTPCIVMNFNNGPNPL